jgi:hypothetical protein
MPRPKYYTKFLTSNQHKEFPFFFHEVTLQIQYKISPTALGCEELIIQQPNVCESLAKFLKLLFE